MLWAANCVNLYTFSKCFWLSMPHVGSASGDDLASSDEIKVFKDEGEDEKRASENLTDLKSSLITEGEQVSYN